MKNTYKVVSRFAVRYADFIEGRRFTPLFEENTNYNSLERRIQKPYGKSQYSTLLNVNKVAKIYYGIETTSFLRNCLRNALSAPGDKACSVINRLEHKLDFQVYRSGYAKSIGEAKELIKHGAVSLINLNKTDIDSMDISSMKAVRNPNYFTRSGEIVLVGASKTTPSSILIRCYMNYFSRMGLYTKWALFKKAYLDACLYENMFLKNHPVLRVTKNTSLTQPFEMIDSKNIFSKSQTKGGSIYSSLSQKLYEKLMSENWHLTKSLESSKIFKNGDLSSKKASVPAKTLFEISLKKKWDAFEQSLLNFSELIDESQDLFFVDDHFKGNEKELYKYKSSLLSFFIEDKVIDAYSAMADYTKSVLFFHKWDNVRNTKINKIVSELTDLKTPEGVESRINSIKREIERLETSSGIKQVGERVVVMQPHKLEAVQKTILGLEKELAELDSPETIGKRVLDLQKKMNQLDKEKLYKNLFPLQIGSIHYESSSLLTLPSTFSITKIARKEISIGQRTFANLLIRSLKSLNY